MAGLAAGQGVPEIKADAPGLVRFLIKPRSRAVRLLWLAGALALASLATAMRVNLGLGVTSGLPMVFYFPALIVVTLVAGWEYGIAALVLGILLAWYAFVPPYYSFHVLSAVQSATVALWMLSAIPVIVLAHYLRVALEASARNEMRYQRLMSVISDVVWLTDAEGNVREPNPAWSRITGVEWPGYAGTRWAEAVHEEDRAALAPQDGSGTHLVDFRLRDVNFGDWRWYRARAVALPGPDGRTAEWITAIRDVHELRLAKERDEMMVGEARHRLKNLVTIIEALAKYSRRRGSENAELDDFLKRFLGRLHALGAAADQVLIGQLKYMEIGSLVRATLAPFLEDRAERFALEGPPLQLSEATGGNVAIAMHELATNALKYGALSVPDGRVRVGWSTRQADDGEHIAIEWEEFGGPPPPLPGQEGFGTRVIKAVPAREKNGDVRLEYRPAGLYCRIAFTRAA